MNYYVMNANGVILYRGTLESCREWAQQHQKNWTNWGGIKPKLRIFYDTGTEPEETL